MGSIIPSYFARNRGDCTPHKNKKDDTEYKWTSTIVADVSWRAQGVLNLMNPMRDEKPQARTKRSRVSITVQQPTDSIRAHELTVQYNTGQCEIAHRTQEIMF